jgi:glycosyltransferase involved in cell wall biosynthesis
MIVSGFPNPAQPFRGIFNLRAAQSLSRYVDIKVFFLRAWKPGRPLIQSSEYAGISVITVAVPQAPGDPAINIALYRWLGGSLLRSSFRGCTLLHSVDAVGTGIVASAWARKARIYHITNSIGSDVNGHLPNLYTHRTVRGWEQHLHGVICESQALAKAFLALYPTSRNVRTIYRGVNLEGFLPQGPTDGPLAAHAPVRFLFVGGFPPYPGLQHGSNTKGGETLLQAWKMAETDLIAAGASLWIAGQQADGERIARWRAGLQRPERVYLSGNLPPEKMPDYFRAADVVLIPSMEEGLPNVSLEAAACGRAVFGSNVGGLPEAILHEQTGLILPAGDVAAWAEALARYAHQVDRLQYMGGQARKRMETNFDHKEYAPKILDFYRTALSESL